MKKFWLSVVVFAIVIVAGDRVLAQLCGWLVSGSHNRHISSYAGRAPSDVVIFGNSRADRHFSDLQLAPLLGTSVTNLGGPQLALEVAEILLRDHLDRNAPPKLVILEATCLFTPPRDLGGQRIFAWYSKRMRQLSHKREPKLYWGSRVFTLLYFNDDSLIRALAEHGGRKERRHDKAASTETLDALMEVQTRNVENYPDNVAALRGIIDLCRERNIELRVVVAPFFPPFAERSHLEKWVTSVRQLVGEQTRIWDYVFTVPGEGNFRDRMHLARPGVDRFIAQLCQDDFFAPFTCDPGQLPAWANLPAKPGGAAESPDSGPAVTPAAEDPDVVTGDQPPPTAPAPDAPAPTSAPSAP